MAQQAQDGNGQIPAVNFFLWLLMLPAISGAIFTRRGFGFRAVLPIKLIAIVVVMAVLHDIGGVAPGKPEFIHGSIPLRFCEIMVPLGLYHCVTGWLRYRRGEGHTEFFRGALAHPLGHPVPCRRNSR